MFIPKKSKFRKFQKGPLLKRITKPVSSHFNFYGKIRLIALTCGRLNSYQLLTMKQTITKLIKKKGKLKLNIFPNIGISKKPAEVRMGKGKGALDHWVVKIKKGITIAEIEIKFTKIGIKAFKAAQYKLPFLTKIIIN